MSNEMENSTGGRFSAGNIERFGWGLFVIFMGVAFYAEELHRIRESWEYVSLYGGGFLLGFWFLARLAGRSLSSAMLAVGTLLVAARVIDTFNLDLRMWPLIVILLGVALLVKAMTNNKED
jgi:hypothetical protein